MEEKKKNGDVFFFTIWIKKVFFKVSKNYKLIFNLIHFLNNQQNLDGWMDGWIFTFKLVFSIT